MEAKEQSANIATGESRPRAWRKAALAGGLALGLQAGILGLAVMIGILDPQPPSEAPLKLPPGSRMRERAQLQQVENTLAQLDRLDKARIGQLVQPVLDSLRPDIAVSQPDITQSIQAMGAMLPMGNFFQGSMTDGLDADSLPPPDPVSFLGESLNAKRIVLLLDVSGSVKTKIERAGLSMEKLREEVHQFVNQLGPNHLFGIIQFTRNWQPFRMELLPATQAVRQEARLWIDSSLRTTGTSGRNWMRGAPNGIQGVLKAAFSMDPQIDEIFIVSDGDFQRTPPGGGGQNVPWAELRRLTQSLQEQSIHKTRLRMLCFYPPEDALPDIRAWVSENGDGSLKAVGQ